MGTGDVASRYKPAQGFWAQSPDHQLAYAAHGVGAFMRERAANSIVRPAQYAIMRAMQDPVEKFDWAQWFTQNFYGRDKTSTTKAWSAAGNSGRIAMDFDNTLNRSKSGEFGPPIRLGVMTLKRYVRSGKKVFIFTHRPESDKPKIQAWLEANNLAQYIDEIDCSKPDYEVLVDDKALRFPQDVQKQADAASTGAFMALLPSVNDAHLLASQEERPQDLHCTLVYFGKVVDLSQQTKRLILQLAQKWAGQNPFDSNLGGEDRFGTAYVVLVKPDPRLLVERAALVLSLTEAGIPIDMTFPDYQPHITLSYTDAGPAIAYNGSTWVGGPITFDRVLVAFGNQRFEIPLMIRKGDLPGHEFHGNQWTTVGAALHQTYGTSSLKNLFSSMSKPPKLNSSWLTHDGKLTGQLPSHPSSLVTVGAAKPSRNPGFEADEASYSKAFREAKLVRVQRGADGHAGVEVQIGQQLTTHQVTALRDMEVWNKTPLQFDVMKPDLTTGRSGWGVDNLLKAVGYVEKSAERVYKWDPTRDQLAAIDPVIELYAKQSKAKIDTAVKDLHQAAAAHIVDQLNLPHAPDDLEAGVADTFNQFSWKIPENSANELRQTLLETLEENEDGTPADFSKAMRINWSDFTKDQADTIAWTEYNTVATQATLSAYQANGVEFKAWITVGDGEVCEDCQANEDQGPIAIDENFDSGDDGPPQHPNCRCNVTSVVNPDYALPSDYSDTGAGQEGLPVGKRDVTQPIALDEANPWTPEIMHRQATARQSNLLYRLWLAQSYGPDFFKPVAIRVKSVEKIRAKAAERGVVHVTDALGARLVVPNEAAFRDVVIPSMPVVGLTVEQVQDYFKHPNPETGYRGGHLLVADLSGFIIEIQVHTPETLAATLATHGAYAAGQPDLVRPAFVQKGDVEGHEFHGNQWTGGEGATAFSTAEGRAFVKTMQRDQYHNGVLALEGKKQILTQDQTDAIYSYKDYGYQEVNQALRYGEKSLGTDPYRTPADVALLQGHLDAAFKAVPPLGQSVIAYRGVGKLDEATYAKLTTPGAVFTDKGYGSVSLSSSVASKFETDMKMTIAIPKGMKVLAGEPKEAELILPRGTQYRIDKVVKESGMKNARVYVTVVQP